MSTGKPIPSTEAAKISEKYQKQIVVITAIDLETNHVHTATYGSQEHLKTVADGLGKVFNELAGGDIDQATHFEKLRKHES